MEQALAAVPLFRGRLRLAEPMARHTTWRVGGPADRYYEPASLADLATFLRHLGPREPLLWIGLGSNLLVRDGGFRGTVVRLGEGCNGVERLGATAVRVEAGASCAKVARACGRQGLVGAEFLAGIPGSLGGALAMNAGCFGGEIWDLVAEVETVDRHGAHHRRLPGDYRVGYRSVEGPAGEWFVAAHLRLAEGDASAAAKRVRELLERRGATQPLKQASAGSVFRNPPGDFAGRLIEAAGLKGRCIGGACVSDKHANFIINAGEARAADIEALIRQVADGVDQAYGVHLETEVRIVGDAEVVK